MNERDMYYNSYGYGGFTPLNNIPNQIPQMINPQLSNNMPYTGFQPGMADNTYANSQFSDMNERLNRLERQIKRLDQRLNRLETPYANNNYNQEPDNNMYMM